MRILLTFDTVTRGRSSDKQLPTGTYVIQVLVGDRLEIHKLVVL